ncbi:F-box protein At1g10780 [Elaeis guineensis]|uniref:F-box protein At1g10780 n=1 Tax=Elaeis guineensis var. tenera TaxID=51953 RepID=A0A6J0PRN6_ELAGV|nr:F-box protein At1g10780 [Elaeis guineensis]XP_019710672.1 F-box protein At1g10780 [Elaeis guineensis]XP_019710673.1 F-box protein At1g10780 [Elaeis guineensis]XP_019710675.1 F-box protein At1g10780 [Elaeis guineensis]
MNAVPDAIVQHILSLLINARDIAACICVSKRWKEATRFIPSLYFPRNSFDAVPRADADATIGRMISSAFWLEELVIYCPFSPSSLASWLSSCSHSLRVLELRMDGAADKSVRGAEGPNRLDCIDVAKGLEALKLWGVSMTRSPNWGSFQRLRTLEIIGATLRDSVLKDAVHACPNLTDLALLGCDGAGSVSIELERLEKCRLDFLGPGNCSLLLSSPSLQILEIQGFSWVRVSPNHCLRSLSIAKNTGRVYKVDVGKLPDLDYLSLRGVQWSWSAIHSVLQCASEVKHLVMKIEFCGDFDTLQPFPEIDLVEFFNNHLKLHNFEIHGAMFAALCQKNSLKNLDSRFVIPCLEEVLITVRSPLNAEQKLNTLESLVMYSAKLRHMVIRISQMKNCHESADDFFEEICKFKHMNYKIVRIE